MLIIDGSYGEGGGQILRSALALSAVLLQPVTIEKIRAGRRNPGLQAQHLAGVMALAEITQAEVEGGRIGSTALRFHPKGLYPGQHRFEVGTAGAISLVLQTILVPLAFAAHPSRFEITGGTHVPWSPPYHYLAEVLLPTLGAMGLKASLALERWGFYPKGGGVVRGEVYPSTLRTLTLNQRGPLLEVFGISAAFRLPRSIAERQRDRALQRLGHLGVPCQIQVITGESQSPGTLLFLVAKCGEGRAGFSSLGEKGKPAEQVADQACEELLSYLKGEGVADPHLADQLLLPLALAPGRSSVTTTKVTMHLTTNLWVVEQLLPGRVKLEGKEGEPGRVVVEGSIRRPTTDDRRQATVN
jgi:RNA 3'-terminal phosphate cyclase (ATP)